MSELGDIVGKKPDRKFVNVSISKIMDSDKGKAAQKFNMGSLVYQSLSGSGRNAGEAARNKTRVADLEARLGAVRKELEHTKKNFDSKLSEARKEGRLQGETAGKVAAETELKNKYDVSIKGLENQVTKSLEVLKGEKEKLFRDFEEQVTSLVIGSLKRILSVNAVKNEEAIIPVITRAVRALGESHSIIVKINPEDFQTVTDAKNIWQPVNGNFSDIKIEDDNRVERGCCIIESDHTSVEVSYEKILNHMEKEFKEIFKNKMQKETAEPAVKPVKEPANMPANKPVKKPVQPEDSKSRANPDVKKSGKKTKNVTDFKNLLQENPDPPSKGPEKNQEPDDEPEAG